MSKKDIARAQGRIEGIRESGWTCGDCGNVYDASVDECPNRLLDEALVGLRRAKSRHRVHKGAPQADQQSSQFGYRTPGRTPEGKVIIVGPFSTREEAEAVAGGLPIVELPAAAAQREEASEPAPRAHLADCPCEDSPCCPWMGDCACQCQCDFIARIEDRVRAELAPRENAAGSHQAGRSATAPQEEAS